MKEYGWEFYVIWIGRLNALLRVSWVASGDERCQQDVCATTVDARVFSFLLSFTYFFSAPQELRVVAVSWHSSGRLFRTSAITNP